MMSIQSNMTLSDFSLQGFRRAWKWLNPQKESASVKEMILHHLADSYEWFLANRATTADEGKSHHRTIAKQGALKVLKTATRFLPG